MSRVDETLYLLLSEHNLFRVIILKISLSKSEKILLLQFKSKKHINGSKKECWAVGTAIQSVQKQLEYILMYCNKSMGKNGHGFN